MDEFIGNSIALDVFVNLFLVVAIVAQRIENLGQCQMRQVLWYLIGRDADSPEFYNSSDGCFRFANHRFSPEQFSIGNHVWMFRAGNHVN